ncbi:hypothetical protein BCR36DRAFT_274009 [Piromyces finnis]|uniref:WAPL domain-containing protein n=1 Tax=Piromyces finnis TaxID=1754191 RepID=A0A1Y1VLM9_9FUNG|nr:hypothetical protein BCR36DRAFT_274009 [Piromyces finnis]|eukprot:ORX59846.1 hypothetical protein BCR36DRAFT_274009 [Piromyces finnis]
MLITKNNNINNNCNNSNNNSETENESKISKTKHERSNTLDSIISSSSLTSLSSLPSVYSSPPSSPEIIEIIDNSTQNNNQKNKKQKKKELEVIEIFSDSEKNPFNISKVTYKTNTNKDDDDDVIIIDDSKAKTISRNYSIIHNKTSYMKKTINLSDYNRIKRQKIAQIISRNKSNSHPISSNFHNYSIRSIINNHNNKSFEINDFSQFNDTLFDLESNNYKMEELEDTFASSTLPKIPRTSSSTLVNEVNDSSLTLDSHLSENEDHHSTPSFRPSIPSINKSQSLSHLLDSRVGRMKGSHLKKSKSFGNIYDFGIRHEENNSSLPSNHVLKMGKSETTENENDQISINSTGSLKRSISSLSYFSEISNNNKEKVINSEIKLLDGSSVSVPILFFKKKRKRLGNDTDIASLTGIDEGENKSNHFYRKTYQNIGSLVKNDDSYEEPYVAMSKMFDDSEESEEEDIDSKNKNKKVKSMFELKELGENKKFKDEIDYLLDGLTENQTTTTKRLSCIDLCKKLSESDFILNLRAYGFIPQLYKILSKEKDKIIQLCLLYFIYTLFQDDGSLDIIIQEDNCLPLLVKFLRIKDDYINIEKLKSTKEKICLKEIKKVIEESKHFENTNISFQLISIKCFIQLLNPSSTVDVKNELKKMLFDNDFSNDKILLSPSVKSSFSCIDIISNRLKLYTNFLQKDYQQWKINVESQKKNIPFDINIEYLNNVCFCLKFFELLNKENDLELSLSTKSKISTYILQLLTNFVGIIYNNHKDIKECYHQILLNCINVLINFFNESKEIEQFTKTDLNDVSSQQNIITEEQYDELFKVLLVFIDQFSPLSKENHQTKLQDIFLLIIGLLINISENNEHCRILLAKQQIGKACSYQSNSKKNSWVPCRFGCICPDKDKKGFLEIIVEIYSNIVKTENYILASYLAILIGFLCLHPDNKVIVKQYLFENSFSTIIQILEQFLQLNTLSNEFVSPTMELNPNALINANSNEYNLDPGDLNSASMIDFTSSLALPIENSGSNLDIGLINGLSLPSSLSSKREYQQDTTTESFLKIIEVLKQP